MLQQVINFIKDPYVNQRQYVEIPQPEPEVTIIHTQADIFAEICGNEAAKQLSKDAIYASEPVSILYNGPPGLGKSAMAHCIEVAMGRACIYENGPTVTEAGLNKKVKARIEEIGKDKRIFLYIDEIERAKKPVHEMLLNIVEGGRLTKTLGGENESYDIQNINICLIATSNNFEKLQRTQEALINRIMIINIEKPNIQQFMAICEFRLGKMNIPRELAWYIATKVNAIWGVDMREAVRIARMCKSFEDVDRHLVNRAATQK